MLGKVLREARINAGLTQERLAFMARMDRSYLSEIERDKKSPTVKKFFLICDAVGVSPAQVGNAVFAAIVWGYYLYVGGDHTRFVSGAVLAFMAFLGGIVTGYIANISTRGKKTPKHGRTHRSNAAKVDPSAFDEIT